GREKILERLPQIRELAIDFEGVDPIEEPIPVRPTAHYSMGGIDADKLGRTPIKGLYAIGECACISVHGANRLGGNSLLDIVVFGKIAGEDAVNYVSEVSFLNFGESEVETERERIEKLFNGDGSEKLHQLRSELSDAMSRGVGIFREEKKMREALEKVREIKERAENLKVYDREKSFNTNLQQTLEFLNMVEVAETIAFSAIERRESRGAHYRTDYPKRDDENFLKHSIVKRSEDGELSISWKPVTITKFQPEERKY
ncbi:MAG: succinate dehydrogenase/fumarate reductase flavoprotein subunit, partial [Thermovibrio sp.]